MSDECVYMGSVACLTHHSVRRLEEDQDSCDWLRAEKAEAAIQRVREQLHKPWKYECECCTRIWIALEGDSDE